ncbi:MAG: 50S ribosomal protein L11 methyltransferase [Caldilineaceae bacterium]
MSNETILEISITCDAEAAEAVSELFNRYNGGDYDDDNEAGEASGGGAVIEMTGFDDFEQPEPEQFRCIVKTFIKPGERGETIRKQIEEGLWYLSRIYPIPQPEFKEVKEEDWANAWKKYYKPLRIGERIVLKPSWEEYNPEPNDLVIELDPGMAFGTGLHPTTRLCVAALEEYVHPGDSVLDLGTGSGVLAIAAAKLGATDILATDIDPIAVRTAIENVEINGYMVDRAANTESAIRNPQSTISVSIQQSSVPTGVVGHFCILVANILAEVLTNLFDSKYDNVPLAEPLAANGVMILSGILDVKAPMVIDAAKRHGLTLVDQKQETDWVALIFKRLGD